MFCDNLAVLQNGKIVASGPTDTVLTQDLIANVFGVRAHIEQSTVHGRINIQWLR